LLSASKRPLSSNGSRQVLCEQSIFWTIVKQIRGLLTGLMAEIETRFVISFLATGQVYNSCWILAETIVWATARLFGMRNLYVAGTAKFTEEGKQLVRHVSDAAFTTW
jgi:hypothetical protein